jgi:N-methylhydantoinase A
MPIPVAVDAPDPADLRAAFDRAHDSAQGFALPDQPVEAVTFRLKARAPQPGPAVGQGRAAMPAAPGERVVHFGGAPLATPVLARTSLAAGTTIEGPAIVEEATSTTVLPPGWTARVLPDGSLDVQHRRRDAP